MDLSTIASFAGIAAGVLSTVSCMGCCKTRVYTSATNKIETDAALDSIIELNDKDRCSIAWSESYWNNAWIPTFLVSPRHCFCAFTDVTSSSYDLNQQVMHVRVMLLCCLPWESFRWFESDGSCKFLPKPPMQSSLITPYHQ